MSARILLDSCVWGGAISPLQAFGHDVIWTGNWEEDPGDTLILDHAFREAVHQLVMNYHLELQNGAIVTADPDRVRIRSGNLP